MALLESPRPGDAREMCRTVEAGFLGRCCACQTPFPAKRCVQFAGTFGAIVPVDLRFEFVQRDAHPPALVLLLLGLASEPLSAPPAGRNGRASDQRGRPATQPDVPTERHTAFAIGS